MAADGAGDVANPPEAPVVPDETPAEGVTEAPADAGGGGEPEGTFCMGDSASFTLLFFHF